MQAAERLPVATGRCFPASAVVTVLQGGIPLKATIATLSVGDMVLVRVLPLFAIRCFSGNPRLGVLAGMAC